MKNLAKILLSVCILLISLILIMISAALFEFLPIDLYRSDASRFQIIDGKILPSFSAIGGMGEKAAQQLQEAAKQGKFTSKEDIRSRGKVSKTILDDMESLGLLGDLPETNQYDFFSMLK